MRRTNESGARSDSVRTQCAPGCGVILYVYTSGRTRLDENPPSSPRTGGTLERVPSGLIGAIERLSRFRERTIEGSPGCGSGALQLPQIRFRLGGIGFHPPQGGIDVVAPVSVQLRRSTLNLLGGVMPGLQLGGGCIVEGGLLHLDLLPKVSTYFFTSASKLPHELSICFLACSQAASPASACFFAAPWNSSRCLRMSAMN